MYQPSRIAYDFSYPHLIQFQFVVTHFTMHEKYLIVFVIDQKLQRSNQPFHWNMDGEKRPPQTLGGLVNAAKTLFNGGICGKFWPSTDFRRILLVGIYEVFTAA